MQSSRATMKIHVLAGMGLLSLAACSEQGPRHAGSERDAASSEDAGAMSQHDGSSVDAQVHEDAALPTDVAVPSDAGDAQAACGPDLAPFVGTYREANGAEHWLRRTATAQLYARVPAGFEQSEAPPSLFVVDAACVDPSRGRLVVADRAGQRARVDLQMRLEGVVLCWSSFGHETALHLLSTADPNADDLQAGCHGGAWTRAARTEAP